MIVYIHGFNSSALSFKAGLVAKRVADLVAGRSRWEGVPRESAAAGAE